MAEPSTTAIAGLTKSELAGLALELLLAEGSLVGAG